jgi:lysozyme
MRRLVTANCTALVQHFEGCKLAAYPDPGTGGSPWTIGWGATGAGIRKGVVWTQAQADARLAMDLAKIAAEVSAIIGTAPTTANQFDALVCFAYNLGSARLATSTLAREHKVGRYRAAQDQFALWNKAGGYVLDGLTTRRAAEAALYGAQEDAVDIQHIIRIAGDAK